MDLLPAAQEGDCSLVIQTKVLAHKPSLVGWIHEEKLDQGLAGVGASDVKKRIPASNQECHRHLRHHSLCYCEVLSCIPVEGLHDGVYSNATKETEERDKCWDHAFGECVWAVVYVGRHGACFF